MIRLANTHEIARISEIVELAYRGYVASIGAVPGPLLDDYPARVAAGQIWVAGDPVMGLLVLIDYPDHLLLDNIAVDPAAQGTGVGRALMEFADAEAVRRGCRELRLYTHQGMLRNIALYQKLGWQETGRGEQAGLARVFFRKRVQA